MILNLISGPRNISTALMYSFAQRSDTVVLDEPFYAVYLSKSKVLHPGGDLVLRTLSHEENEVKQMIASATQKPVLFIKNMAHHMAVMEEPLIGDGVNIFLIRDPGQIIASYGKVIANPAMRDIGIQYQYELFSSLQVRGSEPIVIDAGLLLSDPSSVLLKLCNHCGLAFEQRMLHWPQGAKPYDGVWARYWYANVHQSTGFERQPASSPPLPDHLHSLYIEARSFYEKLLPFSLKA